MTNNNNLMFLDTETTGLSPKKYEPIEISFSIFHNGVRCIDTTLYMRPEKWDTISDEALRINGYTREKLKTLPTRQYACAQFDEAIRAHRLFSGREKLTIVEHSRNGKFDIEFIRLFLLNYTATMGGIFNRYFHPTAINTRDIAKKRLPNLKSYKLVEIAKHLKITVDESKLHGAHYDKELLIEVYRRLTGGMK